MQSSSQIVTTNKPTPSFLQVRCPSCHPANSVRALKGNASISCWRCLSGRYWGCGRHGNGRPGRPAWPREVYSAACWAQTCQVVPGTNCASSDRDICYDLIGLSYNTSSVWCMFAANSTKKCRRNTKSTKRWHSTPVPMSKGHRSSSPRWIMLIWVIGHIYIRGIFGNNSTVSWCLSNLDLISTHNGAQRHTCIIDMTLICAMTSRLKALGWLFKSPLVGSVDIL